MGYTQFPRSGQLSGANSPTGHRLSGTPGYLVAAGDGGPSLEDLEYAYFGVGGPDVFSNAYLVTDTAIEVAGFDPSRASCELYNDDTSADPVFIGGPAVAPLSGVTQSGAGLRLNPGSGRIYDGADRAKRIFAICAPGQSAVLVVVITPNSGVA